MSKQATSVIMVTLSVLYEPYSDPTVCLPCLPPLINPHSFQPHWVGGATHCHTRQPMNCAVVEGRARALPLFHSRHNAQTKCHNKSVIRTIIPLSHVPRRNGREGWRASWHEAWEGKVFIWGGREKTSDIKKIFFSLIFCVRKVNEGRDEVPSSPLLLAAAPLASCGLRLTCTIFTAALSTALHYTLNHLKDLKRPKSPLQLIHPDRGEHGANGRRERNDYDITSQTRK